MRPLLAQYPQDKETFGIDNEYLLGDKLLVRPVLHQGVNKVDVYFPAKKMVKKVIFGMTLMIIVD